jgi:PhoH-like ATPase
VIEGFEDWNDWYSEGKILIADLKSNEEVFHPNQGVVLKGSGCKEHGMVRGDHIVRLKQYYPCEISARNTEQTIALGLLEDPKIPLVILSGASGSGKTLLACAHALEKLDNSNSGIKKIIIVKSLTPVGREIGYLPGTMEDKVRPFLGPYFDNFVHCGYMPQQIETMIERGEVDISPIAFIQGRSISNAIIIIDEVQNLELNILKQIITRAGDHTQIILLGDSSQRFERGHDGRPLDILLERGVNSPLIGTIHLVKSLRSPIASWAVQNL